MIRRSSALFVAVAIVAAAASPVGAQAAPTSTHTTAQSKGCNPTLTAASKWDTSHPGKIGFTVTAKWKNCGGKYARVTIAPAVVKGSGQDLGVVERACSVKLGKKKANKSGKLVCRYILQSKMGPTAEEAWIPVIGWGEGSRLPARLLLADCGLIAPDPQIAGQRFYAEANAFARGDDDQAVVTAKTVPVLCGE